MCALLVMTVVHVIDRISFVVYQARGEHVHVLQQYPITYEKVI